MKNTDFGYFNLTPAKSLFVEKKIVINEKAGKGSGAVWSMWEYKPPALDDWSWSWRADIIRLQ